MLYFLEILKCSLRNISYKDLQVSTRTLRQKYCAVA